MIAFLAAASLVAFDDATFENFNLSPNSFLNDAGGGANGFFNSGSGAFNNPYKLPSGSFADDFHTFTFEWTPDATRWLLDGKPYFIVTADSIAKNGRHWVFDHPFYLILNLAVGGVFDGDPPPTTRFPQEMLVDYVSVSKMASP